MAYYEKSRKVNEAVQQGLARCRHSVTPLVTLSLFIDELHADGKWRDADVARIESSVRHILARVVGSALSKEPSFDLPSESGASSLKGS